MAQKLKRLIKIPKIRLLKKLLGYDEIYTIAIRSTEKGNVLSGRNQDVFIPVKPSAQYWYADPIVVSRDQKEYVFAEAYDRRTGKGHIACAEIMVDPKKMVFHKIIEEDYHMSFPMVFQWEGQTYMIPETSENKSLNLYRCEEFPEKWELVKVFSVDRELVDTVVLEKGKDSLSLLTSQINPHNPLETRFQKYELHITPEFQLIPDNGFNEKQSYNLTDRNAGRILEDAILPTQYSTQLDYGVGLVFRQIHGQEMTEKKKLIPSDISIAGVRKSNMIGIHTYAAADGIEIIDGRYLSYSPLNQWRKLLR